MVVRQDPPSIQRAAVSLAGGGKASPCGILPPANEQPVTTGSLYLSLLFRRDTAFRRPLRSPKLLVMGLRDLGALRVAECFVFLENRSCPSAKEAGNWCRSGKGVRTADNFNASRGSCMDSRKEAMGSYVTTNASVPSGNEFVHKGVNPMEPYVGMGFESEEAARIFYNEYAKCVGFSVRVDIVPRSRRDSQTIGQQFVCSKGWFHSSKRPIAWEGCKAMIRLKKEDSGKWVVTKFEKDHNHELVPPGKVSLPRPHWQMAYWRSFIDKYELQDNQWLQSLYKNCDKWIQVYFQDVLLDNMPKTQISETISMFFDVDDHTTLMSFINQCENAVDSWYEKELVQYYKTSDMKPYLKMGFPMENQVAEIYTKTIFLEFQEQLVQSLHHIAEMSREDGPISTFKAINFAAEGAWNLDVCKAAKSALRKAFEEIHAAKKSLVYYTKKNIVV
ncbi:FAR1-RELATED SEQUENCE 9 protein [Nymphaea thermarum]|nr:FAR1-RELATED SEQUENCE 9 protein [Nymphaea thermarum]